MLRIFRCLLRLQRRKQDGERVAFLFDLYQQMTSLLAVEKVSKRGK